ncbi:amine sulfotransferase-like [Pelobates cultripes]|uniref:Sulfotransferase n=1 Tax=Pelobates cultripes TaxID=61616 RepID=A0AAD1RF92_PELCU|nr:amine sulfotransferase-like [Pelobates cultripes]
MSHKDVIQSDSYLKKHKGVIFLSRLTTPECIDSLENLEIRDSDLFLVTFPKSGTVWSQQIVSLILNEGHRKGTEDIDNMVRAPWIEYNIYNIDFNTRPDPRLFTSHLPHYLMPKDLRNMRGKIIYVYRNPKDVLVSFYHFQKILVLSQHPESWEHCMDLFMSGEVLGGSWFDHIRDWYTNKKDYNILFMAYEEMKKDLRSAIMKICSFLDKKLDDEEVDIIVEKSTFENMKDDPLANYTFLSEDICDGSKGSFLRKGTIGDWKNLMTVAQSEMFDRVLQERMKDLPIKFIWDIDEEN